MAVTRLTDVIVPDVFDAYVMRNTTTKSAIFTSGIVAPNAKMSTDLSGGGRTFQAPFWNDLDNSEPDVASDDPAVTSTPAKITAGKSSLIRQVRSKTWSSADLSGILAGSDPMARIGDRVAAYWGRYYQRNLVASLKGIFNDNIA